MDSDFEELCVKIGTDRRKRKFKLSDHLSSIYRTGYLLYSKKGANRVEDHDTDLDNNHEGNYNLFDSRYIFSKFDLKCSSVWLSFRNFKKCL